MIIVLSILVGILSLFIGFLLHSRVKVNKDLKYIATKLELILEQKTDEQIKLFTDQAIIKELLVQINYMLRYNHQIKIDGTQSEHAMKKMLSNASHDLKTPLTVVVGYIETILLDKDMPLEERQVLLEKVYNKSNDIIQLINKFFDLAKLDSGDMLIPLKSMDICEICRQNILSFYEMLTAQEIQVSINLPEEKVYVLGNEDALNRVMNNLISNAVKYGSDGKILGVDIDITEDLVHIHIWDKGKGIEEKYQEAVFERLYTLEDSRNKSYQGSGLGLTITKRLVEQMDGEIRLKSIPGIKTVFTVILKRFYT